MYTPIINVQILIALMKEHGIRNIVLSAGTRQVPIALSTENDPYFNCYSIVDERSAGYFALGLARQLGEPVAIACTSSTAACNYWPPLAEAFYQHVPLLVLTGDRNRHNLGQLEDQMINQPEMYKNICKMSVDLDTVHKGNSEEFWYCQRLVNEALLELTHNGTGPVHINFRIVEDGTVISDSSVKELPKVRPIRRITYESPMDLWENKLNTLKKAKRILVICGMNDNYRDSEKRYLDEFAQRFNCVLSVDHLSNLNTYGTVMTYLPFQCMSSKAFDLIRPDIIISYAGNFTAVNAKSLLRENNSNCEHWLISEDGNVVDCFHCLTTIFQCSANYFFKWFSEHAGDINNDLVYLNEWVERKEMINFDNIPYSNILAIQELAKRIPSNSIVHCGILNSTRILQHYSLNDNIKVYSNLGTDGIDGSMSTFLGQASAFKNMSYLILGDLSFFYDMNSLTIRYINKNVRILMINNGGGSEFHYSMGQERIPNINYSIAAEHSNRAKEWVEYRGFKYLSAHNTEELLSNMEEFIKEGDKPAFLEVFTHKDSDAKALRSFYWNNEIMEAREKKVDDFKSIVKRIIRRK